MRKGILGVLIVGIGLLALDGPAKAQSLDSQTLNQIESVEDLARNGDFVDALKALKEAEHAIWEAMPLSFPVVEQVVGASEAEIHKQRDNNLYRAGEVMTVYVEPVGYGHDEADGRFRIAMSADLAIENTSGQVLVESKDIFSLATEGRRQHKEFDMVLSFIVPALIPGDYLATFEVTDTASGKSGLFSAPFTVEPDPTAENSDSQ